MRTFHHSFLPRDADDGGTDDDDDDDDGDGDEDAEAVKDDYSKRGAGAGKRTCW